MAAIEERARAKVNLTLKVLGKRADGYHLLESLIVFANVGDAVRLEPGETAAVAVTGPFAGAIDGPNLADTALERLAQADTGLTLGRVTIDKRLPVAAGIGGGSADAAAVLRAACRANPDRAHRIDWGAIAAGLGADVPVCLADRSAVVWGVGEHLEPVRLPKLHAVLVCPAEAAPLGKTKAVFAQLSLPPAPKPSRPTPLTAFADAATLVAHLRSRGNDLSEAARAVMPASARAQAALAALPECRYVSLSGAGPTSFGIFDDAPTAVAAAEKLRAAHPGWWIVSTTLGD